MKKKNKKFAHSDIPYSERLRIQKQAEIVAHRNEAAAVALQIACVALNNTEGLGCICVCAGLLRRPNGWHRNTMPTQSLALHTCSSD